MPAKGFEPTPMITSKLDNLHSTNWAADSFTFAEEWKYIQKETFVFAGFWEAWLVLFWDFFRR